MRLPREGLLHGLALALALTFALAKEDYGYHHEYVEDGIIEDLTFGAHGAIWTKDHRHIQGWTISGEGFTPELHSDRVILTPPHPGSKRGAIWSQKQEVEEEWEAEFQFRASGPERGSGLFQMWYAGNPDQDVKLASLYTVGKFDGLVLAVGMYGGQGKLRAFLNDKSISFKDHHHVDQLSFASCDLNYRNTGHFIHVKLRQTHWTFEVEVDGKPCFQTHKIHLPHGYNFGMSAASAEIPDSFEVSSFVLHKLKDGEKVAGEHGHGKHPDEHNYKEEHSEWVNEVQDHFLHNAETSHMDTSHATHDPHAETGQHEYSADDRGWYWTSEKENPKDEPASHYKSEASRFEDLHDRLSVMSHQLNILFHDLSTFKRETEERHDALLHYVKPLYDYAEYSKHQMETLSKDVAAVRSDIEGKDYSEHLANLHNSVHEGYYSLASGLKDHSPRMGFFLFIIMAFQVMLLASYIIYRRRVNSAPKKYL